MTAPLAGVLIDLDNTLFHWTPCDQVARVAVHQKLRQDVDISFETFMALHDEARLHFKSSLKNQAASHNRALFFKWVVNSMHGEKKLNRTPNSTPDLIVEMYDLYWHTFFQAMQPQTDAIDVLKKVSEHHPIALVTNHTTDVQLRKVSKLGFAPYLQTIVTSEEIGVEKPDAKIFGEALRRLDIEADQAVMIGDHPTGDIAGAHQLGIRTIHTREFDQREAPKGTADHVIQQLADVLPILEIG
jgi:HAD superfamily hydrolase (TIGR01549 family)